VRIGCSSTTRSSIARQFGYEDATYTLAVEQLMQRYYRTAMDISLLNEMLLQLFSEAILNPTPTVPTPINARFQTRNDYSEVTSDDVFTRQPSRDTGDVPAAVASNPEFKGVRADTIRSLQQNLWMVDEEFRQNPRHHRLFLEYPARARAASRAPYGA
jgi:[protein-PII] uridylyltransferase